MAHVGTRSPDCISRSMYYTGKNIHLTSGSRTANTTDLKVGDVLSADPFGHDHGQFKDLANPTATWLHLPLWIVTDVPTDAKRGGDIKAVPLAECSNGISGVHTKADQDTLAGAPLLAATDMASASVNQRYLVDVDETATGSTNLVIKTIKAAGMTTNDSGTTANYLSTVVPI